MADRSCYPYVLLCNMVYFSLLFLSLSLFLFHSKSLVALFTTLICFIHRSLDVSYLAYLSSEQALSDLAYFVTKMKAKLQMKKSRWIAFGGSYPGNLAAWARLKYPHLIHAAIASSAPVQAKLNFKGKDFVLSLTMKRYYYEKSYKIYLTYLSVIFI